MITKIDITNEHGMTIKRVSLRRCSAEQLVDLLETLENCVVTWEQDEKEKGEN